MEGNSVQSCKGTSHYVQHVFGGFPLNRERGLPVVMYLDQVRAPGVVYSWWISRLGLMPKFLRDLFTFMVDSKLSPTLLLGQDL